MVPVRLKLRNFLSYGESAEPLEFDVFHVACLSGGNGQGKSALLDAMTWAIWGQARKSSEARKPDEELLRVGSREMEVELVFQLEGTSYRVVRSYYRTVSGKTSKPGLEFQVEDGGGGWRTLTGTTIAETQEAIERAIRLDYDTFINSAFLLQGRSDEFTKKRSSERKQILARILGLDRFAHLEKAARARHAEADAVCQAASAEIERLEESLKQEPVWREELVATEAVVEEQTQAVEQVRKRLDALAQQIATLDELARRADEQRRQLEALEHRRTDLTAERAALAQRIEQAETLIAQAEQIRRDHDRYLALDGERTTLDEQREQKQGFEEQVLRLREELQRRRQEEQGRLLRLDAQQAADRKSVDELRVRLAMRPAIEAGLAEATEAQAEVVRMKRILDERLALQRRMDGLEKRIAHERGILKAKVDSERQRVQTLTAAQDNLAPIQARCVELTTSLAGLPGLQEELDELQAQGTRIAGELASAKDEVVRLEGEVTAVDAKLDRLRQLDTETCPTCGTTLTDVHRREVEEGYLAERRTLLGRIDQTRDRVGQLASSRLEVGGKYRQVRAELAALQEREKELAAIHVRLDAAQRDADELARTQASLLELEARLQADEVAPAMSAELTELSEALIDRPFDESRFEQIRERAAQVARFRAEQQALEEAAGRLDALEQQIARRERDLAALREGIASGEADGPVRQRLEALTAQIAALAYDGARHDEVRRELASLREAPRRFVELGSALNNAAEWKERRARLADDLERIDDQATHLRVELAAAAERLDARSGHTAERTLLAGRLAQAEGALRDLQTRCGALQARLQQCADNRERMEERRREHRDARRERALYDHLRRAFSRNGIPALIIEQTIPEVEERANVLLDRLTGGRTRVHLETLRDKKAGGTRETLDIRITDEHGVSRAYETFSGGEAFRVNFALRIALAQLLADRAGVRIRTLVIDEGFGTQDKQGVEALVESIQTIRGDFEKVIVITHLDELKDAFPIRIEVEKDPVAGSTFQMVGV